MIFQKVLSFLTITMVSFSVGANAKKEANQEPKKEGKKNEKKEPAEEFIDSKHEMPPFHMLSDFKNGHVKLNMFSIPIIRKDMIASKIDIELILQAEDYAKSLELYKLRREFQDRLYSYFYFLFDFIWEEGNFHPNLDALRSNIKKAVAQIDKRKLVKDIYITQILVKNP